MRRKIRITEGNTNVIYLLRDFAAGVYLSEAQNPIPPPPPLTHSIRVYIILINTDKGGGGMKTVESERRLEGQQFTKLGQKYQHD
jgi:hypothetical protein